MRIFMRLLLSLRTVNGVLQGVSHLDAESIIQLGLLLLIATPVVRVIFCLVGFHANATSSMLWSALWSSQF